MISSLRTSTIRLIVGGSLGLIGLGVFAFVLPDASQRRSQRQKAAADAKVSLERQQRDLEAAQTEAQRIRVNRETLDELMKTMPAESVGKLAWKLSKTLFDLTTKHTVRLISVKYGAPAHEGTKGMQLESVDVEFTTTGVYMNLKSFMLSLEGSKLPFAVVSAKLDESPEGAHLIVVLRAFRRTEGPADTLPGENS
jgi:hypothetical protein